MSCNKGNIDLDYRWIKFHSTVGAVQMQKIAHLIKKFCKLKYYKLKQAQEISGKLQHTSFVISVGKGPISPI